MEYPRKVYVITHNKTNRNYIGSSYDAVLRFYQHISDLRGGRHIVEDMQKDFDEHGEDYSFAVLDSINGCDENHKEYEWQKKYQSNVRGIGYNYRDTKWRSCEYAERRTKIRVVLNGEMVSLAALAKETGLSYGVLYDRVHVRKWDIEKAMTTPVGKRGGHPRVTQTSPAT